MTEFPLPAEFALPNDITTGPDGAVWTTDSSLGRIWRISTKGKIRSYELGQQPGGIVTAHGSMWVTDAGGDAIHRVETDGSSTRYALADGAFPIDITAGPDGALWFTEGRGDAIGRLALDGTITEYPLPTTGAFAGDITAGPDGALHFSEALGNKVGRITTAGAITEFTVPGADPLPGPIVAGPDGALYVSERNDNVISRMTTSGEFTDEFTLPRENADPRLDIGFDPPVTAEGTTFSAKAGGSANRTVATFSDANPNARPGDYCVTISWGDGSKSDGSVRRAADGSFEVRGRHSYHRKGTYKVVVRITDGVGKGLDAKVESRAYVTR